VAKAETEERYYAYSGEIKVVKPRQWWNGWGNIFVAE